MECRYCSYSDGHHSPHCPKPGSVRMEMMEIWQRGYNDGRAGKDCASQTIESYHLTYKMGWNQGNVALEEAQNGFNPGLEGHQW